MIVRPVVVISVALGCSGGAGGSSNPDGGPSGDGATQTYVLGRAGLVHLAGSTVVARFFDGATAGATCTDTHFGTCTISSCTNTETYVFMPMAEPYLSAGTITADGASGNAMGDPDDVNQYTITGPARATGETVTITAAGGVVPAFTGTPRIPAPITVTAPALPPDSFDFTIDVATGLTASWSGGEGMVELRMTQAAVGNDAARHVVCLGDAADGSLHVPSGLLALMNGLSTSYVTITSSDLRTVAAGDFTVTLAAWPASYFVGRATLID